MKMPALLRYLPRLHHTHFAYVGSIYGTGAWAVAEACATLDFQCTLFIAQSNDTPPWLPYIEKTGANLIWCAPQPVATLHDMVTTTRPDLYNLPLGFDTSDFIDDMAEIIRNTIFMPSEIPSPLGGGLGRGVGREFNSPPEIWVASLSGVLARSASLAFPDATIHAVSAARHPGDVGGATIHYAPEKFHKPANTPPPYPACPFSCAKIWQFAEKQAVSGAFILNVGY